MEGRLPYTRNVNVLAAPERFALVPVGTVCAPSICIPVWLAGCYGPRGSPVGGPKFARGFLCGGRQSRAETDLRTLPENRLETWNMNYTGLRRAVGSKRREHILLGRLPESLDLVGHEVLAALPEHALDS